ncbi:hypothetical protein MTR_1g037040 [Medicago truncatula]|uniref:O-methyltransferase domain-containing protein n=1 Tax=Medicago truncatula TaxID=3880 RepID=G7ZWT1_MEDTR|nr:hypothetical protein MTR_1g037040 [Medicago truncatula]
MNALKQIISEYPSIKGINWVTVLDYIILEAPNPSNMSKHSYAIDNLMLFIHYGKEKTENKFQKLCMSYGFSKFHIAWSDISTMSCQE